MKHSKPGPSPRNFPGPKTLGRVAQRPLSPPPRDPIPAAFVNTWTLHPLLYRKRIERVDDQARPGDLLAVYQAETEQLIGYGLYNPRSEIAIRMVRHDPALPDDDFWQAQLERAVALRRQMLRLDEVTDAYRVLHAEADGFPGLVVDKIGDVLSAEVFSLGMYQRIDAILARLGPLCDTRHTLVQVGEQVLAQEGFVAESRASAELPEQVTIREHGSRFRVRFRGGHKTGFFCDQRDNRRLLATFCEGKSVLDLCCYTGGFAVQARRLGNAAEVIGVDLDEEPLKLARENANLNQVGQQVRFVQADAFAYMRDMIRNQRQFDVVVLDPPKLIRSRAEIEEGTRRHFDLNRLAMQLVKPAGLLLTCTCAGLLPEEEFRKMIYAAARRAGPLLPATSEEEPPKNGQRDFQILFKTGAAPDHPIAGFCPETEYLNAAWLRMR